jgi:hypothetical protein
MNWYSTGEGFFEHYKKSRKLWGIAETIQESGKVIFLILKNSLYISKKTHSYQNQKWSGE